MPSVTTTVTSGGTSIRAVDVDDRAAELHVAAPRPVVEAARRPFFPFTAVLLLIVLGLIFGLARGRVADPDIWWHLHNAQYLVQNHALPRLDMYSFTVAGHPWMNHEWLSEIPFYFAWTFLGLSGIDAVTITLLSLIYLGVLYLAWKESRNFKAATIATVFAIFLGMLVPRLQSAMGLVVVLTVLGGMVAVGRWATRMPDRRIHRGRKPSPIEIRQA